MKKNMIIFFVILLSCLVVNVYALPDEVATVIVGEVETPVYNVETVWGKMEFTYNEQINYIWNDELHVYDLTPSTYKWIGTDNYIDITNKSYNDINVALTYNSLNNNVKGSFDKNSSGLTSKEKKRFTLNLEGSLSKNSVEYTKVGTVSLSIS